MPHSIKAQTAGKPVVILAHMVKGYKIPEAESKILCINRKMSRKLKSFRDHFQLDIKDEDILTIHTSPSQKVRKSTIIFTADVKR